MSKAKLKTVDEYLATLPIDQRAALEKVRQAVRAAAPEAEEGFSYGLPAFRLNGRPLVAYGAAARHCSFFPMSGDLVNTLAAELKTFDTSKGTIRFPADKPLPANLIRKVVKARLVELGPPQTKTVSRPKRATADAKPIIEELKRLGTKGTRDGMARYGLPSENAFGVPVGMIQKVGKRLGRNQDLAEALWATGWYEARLLAAFIGEPERLTPALMDRWRRDFDSWGVCDTVCFHLFDRSPHAYRRVQRWAELRGEFDKRAAFALLACLAGHDKTSGDEPFLNALPLIEAAATDGRNFVKKGVSWALRGIGRRSPRLHAEAMALAQRLAESSDAAARWVGKDALRDLTKPAVLQSMAAKSP